MKLLPGDFKKLQISLCSSLLMLALGGAALYLMNDGYRLALRERAAAQSQRNEQSGKLQRARAEEHEIMEKISLFQSLQQRGVIGPEQRLDWVELLRDIRDKRQLIELSYEIEPQRPLDTPVDAGLAFKVSPMIAYALRDNMAIGGRFIYSRSLLKLDKADLNLGGEDSDLNFEVNDYYSLRHSYSVAVIWRQYIPLGRNKRFALLLVGNR